ncbi:lytic transglycosylase domain-containing protein [Paenirhodobacter sp. CAU 1674]|uniref:lytic transglycosylase domain-containing protein n=1 Tax=Paenirhodobacter sp. CAU 1674 TaxID=3032596 RepID=UPI0023D9EE31|nr:lytic transglycosylase domain-containing protein [Paenirhodobacter sp. CAU 1674]MDF2142634.1 lytic transglycosylase domain-containing protein [Paenirhodobacter sp. CAU 1674]
MPCSHMRHGSPPAVMGRVSPRRILLCLLSGLYLGVIPGAPLLAQSMPGSQSTAQDPYAALIADAAQRFALPERWIRAIMQVESAGDRRAVSAAGAMGLMQIMPATWAELRLRHRLGTDPFAPRDNILAGAAYLREMLDRYGSVGAMLAAYNAGPARYEDYLATGRALPPETRAYVATLVPMLNSSAPLPAIPRAPDWRAATLFVGVSDAAPVQFGDRLAAPLEPLHDLAPGAETGLFVARSDEQGAP